MAAQNPGLAAGDTSSINDQGVALQEGPLQPEELWALKPSKIITSIGQDYSAENGLKGLQIPCALMMSLTLPAFPNRSETAHNFQGYDSTEDKYSRGEVMEVLQVQRSIIDPPYDATNVNPGKPGKVASRTSLTELP